MYVCVWVVGVYVCACVCVYVYVCVCVGGVFILSFLTFFFQFVDTIVDSVTVPLACDGLIL